MATRPDASKIDTGAVYFELNPKLVLLVRVANVITLLMVLIAIVCCFVQGPKNHSYYLLVANLGISGLVCLVVNWWYKSGDLGSEKYWFILLLGAVILFQCLSADIFVFKEEEAHPPHTTVTPRTPPHNGSTQPFPWTSLMPPTHRIF